VAIFAASLTTIVLAVGVVSRQQTAWLARAEFLAIGLIDCVKAARRRGRATAI
jgi:ABC-type dipeptide/oligopeptide/nickel transport system permease subunit